MQAEKVRETIIRQKLIAIIRGIEPTQIVATAEALFRGGIRLVEVTYDQASDESREASLRSIRCLAKEMDGRILAGAGTVLTVEQASRAVEAGALYIVSPDTNAEVIRQARALGAVSIPGAFTPTEIAAAHAAGADFVKLFPAGSLGSEYVKAIRAPLSHVLLLAVGGVDAENIPAFLKAGVAGFGIGGNLVDKRLVKEGRFDEIEARAGVFVAAVQG